MVQTKVTACKDGAKNGKAWTSKKGTSSTTNKPVRKGRRPTASALDHIESESVLDNTLTVNPNKVEIQYYSDSDLIWSQQNFYENSTAFQSDDNSVDLNVYHVPSRRGAGASWKLLLVFFPNLVPLVWQKPRQHLSLINGRLEGRKSLMQKGTKKHNRVEMKRYAQAEGVSAGDSE